jgi:CRISPR/Cas system CSM-associated protein Csm4 (group 5 of RAMP superfamily)
LRTFGERRSAHLRKKKWDNEGEPHRKKKKKRQNQKTETREIEYSHSLNFNNLNSSNFFLRECTEERKSGKEDKLVKRL